MANVFYEDAIKKLINITRHRIEDPSAISIYTLVILTQKYPLDTLPSLKELCLCEVPDWEYLPVNVKMLLEARRAAGLLPLNLLQIHIRNTGISRKFSLGGYQGQRDRVVKMERLVEEIATRVGSLELYGETSGEDCSSVREVDDSEVKGITALVVCLELYGEQSDEEPLQCVIELQIKHSVDHRTPSYNEGCNMRSGVRRCVGWQCTVPSSRPDGVK